MRRAALISSLLSAGAGVAILALALTHDPRLSAATLLGTLLLVRAALRLAAPGASR